ncbi:alpha/beta fold hydrolase [Gallaecimonas xiamenensis]|uniref:Lysophospholipase n=1 Tax=Gallaecimonas xiamenensis 3-C-1 TaxID=745411 RepID=K2JYS0_9GAMM|nr:alpha/beta fold hydrolase [Gallaecimonas xiamenensis]EKE75479.1 lysophospholipase [Gallaecimonas xiamenensis 3-C-1]
MWLTEDALKAGYQSLVHPYFEGGQIGSLLSPDGVELHYRLFLPPGASTLLVLSSGRTESVLKYQELIFELGRLGIAVAALDHRGQGFSGRLTDDPLLGYVEDFDHYAEDLHLFVNQVVLPLGFKRHWLLAHSMGGCIAALYLAAFAHPFDKVAMTSPMLSINTAPFPNWVAKSMARWQSQQDKRRGQPRYVLTTGPYQRKPFEGNGLSHSHYRYELCQDWLEAMPDARLGGPSAQWLDAAFLAMDKAVKEAGAITVPVLVLVAGEDKVVSRTGQEALVAALPKGSLQIIDGGWHELLLEEDGYRLATLERLWAFFND